MKIVIIDGQGGRMGKAVIEQLKKRCPSLETYTTKKNGTGMGLFLVKKILESYGGRIDVTSRPGEGTCFTIHFPLDAASPV